MVEPGRPAAAREAKKTSSSADGIKMKQSTKKPEKKQSRQCTGQEAESPSYRLALRSIFSCRNSTPAPADRSNRTKKQQLGCSSAPSICKQQVKQDKGDDSRSSSLGEPCKRRASVSGASERCVKKPQSEASNNKLGGSSSSSSSTTTTTGGGSFRAGMQLRRLSGCYECHMVVDPILFRDNRDMSPCPDCGEMFVRPESLELHQSVRHAVSELGSDDTSRNIIEIIFQSSWLKKQSPVCSIHRILKVHNTPRTLARFEDYRDAVKAKAAAAATKHKHPRCTADGNELLRFHCAALRCSLGLHGATHLCDAASAGCDACAIIRDGFSFSRATADGIRTMATSGRAHDAAGDGDDDEQSSRAMLVCRVIAGRVKRPQQQEDDDEEASEYESVAGTAGVYSNMEELQVFNPTAILPCFVVIYKA